jgi:hypothetical protein
VDPASRFSRLTGRKSNFRCFDLHL